MAMDGGTIRPAADGDRDALVRIWHQGWHDAHGELVPPSILTWRTVDHFRTWLGDSIDQTFVTDGDDGVDGFYMLDGVELSKLYIRREARGSGVAVTLLAHAEHALAARGVSSAELFCTVGNRRAQRFYERQGWRWTKTFDDALWCPDPAIHTPSVPTHRYTKTLS